jgi:hypothetical protein
VKKVYTSENHLLVGNARGLLESRGIPVLMRNEYASGVMGEVPVFETWPELWVVNDADYERACDIINTAFTAPPGEPWACTRCGEQNDASFEFCWQCGADHQAASQRA